MRPQLYLSTSRLDAKKLLVRYRRTIPQNVRDIGIWFDIMQTLTRIAVITNAFIIAVTSDFIPQLVYKYSYSEGSLQGYVNFTLSYFDTKDLDTGSKPYTQNTSLPEMCRYEISPIHEGNKNTEIGFLDITFLPGLKKSTSTMRNSGRFGLQDYCLL